MPPPRGSFNPLEGPADYDMTSVVHSDTYAAIDPTAQTSSMANKTVFISGASKGIGRSIAVSFARAGAPRIAVGARSSLSATISAMHEALSSSPSLSHLPKPEILPVEIDVSSPSSVASAAALIRERFGRLDILINNAGIFHQATITESDPEQWLSTLKVNLMGPYLSARAFIPLMLEAGGDKTIVTTSSVGAHCRTPGLSAYQTSKLAELRFAEFVAAEYGEKGVTAFCVHPGNIPTDVIGGLEGLDPAWRHSEYMIHLIIVFVDTPELCGDTLVFLTSEKREWLNGRYINVTWDMPELVAKKDEIVKGDKLKVRLVV